MVRSFLLLLLISSDNVVLKTDRLSNAEILSKESSVPGCLLAYYPFNGNANDESGNGNNGVVRNGAKLTTDRFDKPNSAYYFDGEDDYIIVTDKGKLSPKKITVTAMVYVEDGNPQAIVGKINKSAGYHASYLLGINYDVQSGFFWGLSPPGYSCYEKIKYNPDNPFIANKDYFTTKTWHYLVGTFEDSIQKLYIDGILVQTRKLDFREIDQCRGKWWDDDDIPFKGKIDEVRVYGCALNQQEVTALSSQLGNPNYLTEKEVDLEKGLVAYYPFNGDAEDKSGKGHHGILRNGVSFVEDRCNQSNSAAYFDGYNDFIEVNHDGALSNRDGFSFSLQFKTENLYKIQTLLARRNRYDQTEAQFQAFINWERHPGVGYGHHFTNNEECNSVIHLYNVYANTGENTVISDKWHCVVGTFDGEYQRIYLDGVLIESVRTPLPQIDKCGNVPMTIGKYTNPDPQAFEGTIDEVRIYDRALNQAEVEALCSELACPGYITKNN